MPETVVLRWGCKTATSGSRYRVRRTVDRATWTELAAAQAATSPYASPTGVLASNVDYGAASIPLVNASALAASGYLWLDESYVQWTGKSTNTLTGCTWYSGAGTYASGSEVVQAHESYTDSGVSATNEAIIYQVTHIDASDRESPPTEFEYLSPAPPQTNKHCRVLVKVGYGVGHGAQANVQVRARLVSDDQFTKTGTYLDRDNNPGETVTTGALGIAGFDLVRDRYRWAEDRGTPTRYEITIGTGSDAHTLTLDEIPDADWAVVGASVWGT